MISRLTSPKVVVLRCDRVSWEKIFQCLVQDFPCESILLETLVAHRVNYLRTSRLRIGVGSSVMSLFRDSQYRVISVLLELVLIIPSVFRKFINTRSEDV